MTLLSAKASVSEAASAARLQRSKLGTVVAGLQGVGKSFGGTIAVEGVSFDLRAGGVLALLGENGAGKSTCVKLFAGVYAPNTGAVLLDGQPVEHGGPAAMRRRGVAVMHQHPGLFGDLPVYENVFMGHVPRTPIGAVDDQHMRNACRDLLRTVGLSCAPDDLLRSLRTSEQQLVEIARALSTQAKVLIMDEPTASLSAREVDRLFDVVADLKTRGVAMMFVSHRMDEIYRIADQIAVLRDGHLITVQPAAELGRDQAVQAMIGRPLSAVYPSWQVPRGAEVLRVENLSRNGAFSDVSFSVQAGEVLGFAGLVGSGRTEIARVLFGIDTADSGTILIDGKPASFSSPSQAMAAGIAYVSEDRLGQSLVMDFPILTNASLAVIGRATLAGLVRRARELALVKPDLDRLSLKFASYDHAVNTLSGGNQQKVVLAKWLATKPQILVLDEPTQGIDIRSKAEVHAMIAELAQQGLAIILISSELPELIGMADRTIVLREGRVTGSFSRNDIDQERVIRAATDADVSLSSLGGARTGAPTIDVADPDRAEWSPLWRRMLARREAGLACVIALVLVPVSLVNPHMLSSANLTALAMDAALLVIVAAGQLLVVVTRNIDLSVASVIGLTAFGSADFMRHFPDAPVLAGIAVASALGLTCGLANGLVITLGRVPSIVVTLGTLAAFRGLDSLWTGGKQISADQVPQRWLALSTATVFGLPAVVIIAILALVVVNVLLRKTPAGRELFAIGSNPDGAALIGIRRTGLVIGAFAAAGLLAGFDGALWASRYATIDPRLATGFELTVIAAVVVGGVAIRGGSGTILGIVFGAVTLLVIQNGLTLLRVEPLWLQGIYGVVIILAIGVDALVARSARQMRPRP